MCRECVEKVESRECRVERVESRGRERSMYREGRGGECIVERVERERERESSESTLYTVTPMSNTL